MENKTSESKNIKNNTSDKIEEDESDSNPIWSVWNLREAFQIPDTQLTIKGFSIAALRTNFMIKELNVMLDGGLSSPFGVDHIFITHGHADHTASLPFHIYNKKENSKIQIYFPSQISDYIKDFIESAYVLSSDCDIKTLDIKREDLYLYKFYSGNSVNPNDNFEITIKNKKYTIEVVKCYHSVPCVGYGFIEKRQKLKEEYKTLTGKEIGELRKKGENIYFEQQYPFLLFLGDTSKEILKDENIKKYRTIMIECTFLLEDDYSQAEKTFHIHWKDLEVYIRDNPNITFVLYHFSQRYKKKELIEFFSRIDLKNIVPWIH